MSSPGAGDALLDLQYSKNQEETEVSGKAVSLLRQREMGSALCRYKCMKAFDIANQMPDKTEKRANGQAGLLLQEQKPLNTEYPGHITAEQNQEKPQNVLWPCTTALLSANQVESEQLKTPPHCPGL